MAKPFVLIIEDDRDIAALFRHVVDMVGYRTATLSAKEAIERLSNSKPDIVMIDLDLPGFSGREILKGIREDKRLSHTKIIVVTANTYVVEVEPDLILSKPVSIEQLSLFIRRFGVTHESHTIPNPWHKKTGLYNQSFFMHRLDSSLTQSKENDQYLFAILSFQLGQIHSQENLLDTILWEATLRELVESLKDTVRPTDTIASFDQDNFYILIENLADEDIPIMVATRLQEMINKNLVSIGYKNQKPIRVAITKCDSGYGSVKEILQEAKRDQTRAISQGEE
jgi:diguanylate cyclase (GGDEF)-like protein